MIKRALALTIALALVALGAATFMPATIVDAAGICDPTRSNLCNALVDVWQFDVPSSQSYYYGSFADTPLLKEDNGVAIQGGDKIGGTASVLLGQGNADRLVVRRSGGFTTGNWTMSSWVYLYPQSTARDITLLTTYDGPNTDGFTVSWHYTSGAWYPQAFGWESETGTYYSKVYSASTSTQAWHLVTVTMSPYGPYGKSQVCLSVDNAAFQCGPMGYSLKGNTRDLYVGAAPYATGYNNIYLDGFGIWARTWDTADMALYYNSAAGRAFPFY
jgi:hypothetical protein